MGEYFNNFKTKLESNKRVVINYIMSKYKDTIRISAMNGSNRFLTRKDNGFSHIQIWNGSKPEYAKSGEIISNNKSNHYFIVTFATSTIECPNTKEAYESGWTDLCFSLRKEAAEARMSNRSVLVVTNKYVFEVDDVYIKQHIVRERLVNGSVFQDIRLSTKVAHMLKDTSTPKNFDENLFQPKYIQHVEYSKYRNRGKVFSYIIKNTNKMIVMTGFAKSVPNLFDVLSFKGIAKAEDLRYRLNKGVVEYELENGYTVVVREVTDDNTDNLTEVENGLERADSKIVRPVLIDSDIDNDLEENEYTSVDMTVNPPPPPPPPVKAAYRKILMRDNLDYYVNSPQDPSTVDIWNL